MRVEVCFTRINSLSPCRPAQTGYNSASLSRLEPRAMPCASPGGCERSRSNSNGMGASGFLSSSSTADERIAQQQRLCGLARRRLQQFEGMLRQKGHQEIPPHGIAGAGSSSASLFPPDGYRFYNNREHKILPPAPSQNRTRRGGQKRRSSIPGSGSTAHSASRMARATRMARTFSPHVVDAHKRAALSPPPGQW